MMASTDLMPRGKNLGGLGEMWVITKIEKLLTSAQAHAIMESTLNVAVQLPLRRH
jgi:hypothetical protein